MTTPSRAVQVVLDALGDWTGPTDKGYYAAKCAAHDDTTASLSIWQGDTSQDVAVKCFAGCVNGSIWRALRLYPSLPDLREVRAYDYTDEGGKLLYQSVRYEPKAFRPWRLAGTKWYRGLGDVRRVLYRLPELLAAPADALIFVPEGEKDVDNLAAIGLVATTNQGGADSWRPEYAVALKDRDVVLLPDRDEVGRKHVVDICRSLSARARVLELPGTGKDVSDWIDAGGTRDQLLELAAQAPDAETWLQSNDSNTESDEPTTSREKRRPQSTILLDIARSAVLFHNPALTAFASVDVATHREAWPLRSTGFRRWLTYRFFTEEAKAPGSQAVIDVVRTLEASAVVDGAEQPTYIRVAEHEGAIWVDLCNERWEAVQITRQGWAVVPSTVVPVRFLRYKGMTALPHPMGGGDLTELRPFVNVQDDGDFSLVVGFLLCALRQYANMKYPVLCFVGEQGSAKSVMTRVVKKLLDPSTSDLRSEQKEARDLMIYATHSWCLALDNVSHLPDWLSDALCRLATGGGFSTRTLYEDDEEMIFEATRPVVLNGITDIATRADLLDRTLLVRVPAIPESQRRVEAEFWEDFDAAHPRILGGLFDAAAAGLREFPTTKLDKTPRMADAATWVVAAESALPWAPGTFLVAYQQSSATATAVVLDSELIVPVLLRVISKAAFEGTASELLIALNEEASDAIRRDRYWPKDATRLSGKLRRIAPSLRAEGIAIEFDDGRGTRRTQRTIRIPKVGSTAPHNDPIREGAF